MAWRHYDFDANWDKVYKVWQGDAVQDVLAPDMEEWCEEEAYFDRDEDGHLHKPTWHRGDSLWQYSRSNYHAERSMEAANTLMESENVAERLLADVRRGGLDISLDELYETEIWNKTTEEYENRCQPRTGALEALILCGGEQFVENAQYVLARKLFPEEQIAVATSPGSHCEHVFLCNCNCLQAT